jgi:hypothetical protein
MTIEIFPAVTTDYPVRIKKTYDDIENVFGGNVLVVKRQRFPIRIVTLPLSSMTINDLATIDDFFTDRAGSYDPFWWFDLQVRHTKDEYVGYGTGAEATLDLHSKSTVSNATLVLRSNGTPISKTLSVGTGLGAADQVIFTTTLGNLVTADYWGKLRLKLRLPKEFEFSWYKHLRYQADLILTEKHW